MPTQLPFTRTIDALDTKSCEGAPIQELAASLKVRDQWGGQWARRLFVYSSAGAGAWGRFSSRLRSCRASSWGTRLVLLLVGLRCSCMFMIVVCSIQRLNVVSHSSPQELDNVPLMFWSCLSRQRPPIFRRHCHDRCRKSMTLGVATHSGAAIPRPPPRGKNTHTRSPS
jgi:hypothetical protein